MTEPRWLILIHRIPPKPGYLRVKIWRRLQGVGAISLKNSVYVLPKSEQAREDLQWIAQEIVRSGGEAVLCESRFVDGISDADIEKTFTDVRESDYLALGHDANQLLASIPEDVHADLRRRASIEADVERLRRRLDAIGPMDFFGAPSRSAAERTIGRIDERLKGPQPVPRSSGGLDAADYRGRTWVTRRGIHVDRIASAWLIRRFIDPLATFRFVTEKAYAHETGELRFDMFNGEFTHEGDLVSFEVLVSRFGLSDAALTAIAEIIHDIDLKERKFGRPETPGFERMIAGICAAHREDEGRLARGAAILDDLYESFTRYA